MSATLPTRIAQALGRARAAALTAAQRKAIARKAARARWAKPKRQRGKAAA